MADSVRCVGRQIGQSFAVKYPDLLFGRRESILTELEQLGAAPIGGERRFERKFAALHGLDDGFQFFEGIFKTGWGF